MNNVDRTFPGVTFKKTQEVHGYDYDENGNRIFTVVGEDLIYDRIQEANNSTDMEMIKSQLLPSVEQGENAVDKYFKAYGDINDLTEVDYEKIVDKSNIDSESKTQNIGSENEIASSDKAGEKGGEKE